MRTRMRVLRWLLIALPIGGCGGGGPVFNPDAGVQSFGVLDVTWTIKDRTGTERPCAEFAVTDVIVRLGGPMMSVPCDQGQVTFDSLLEGRYPVVAEARSAGALRGQAQANADVVGGQTVTLPLVFDLDSSSGVGDFHVQWRIDGRSAQDQCDQVGASRVRVISQDGSRSMVDESAPCIAGELTVPQVPVGVYSLTVRLERSTGERITAGVVPAFEVRRDQTVETNVVNLLTTGPTQTRIVGTWTINSSAAADACAVVGGRSLTFSTVARPPQIPTSTTVGCAAGQAILNQGIGGGLYTVRFTLQYSLASVTSTTVTDLQVVAGRTTSVAVDLRAN